MKVSRLQSQGVGRPDSHMLGSTLTSGSGLHRRTLPLCLQWPHAPALPASAHLKYCPPLLHVHGDQSRALCLFLILLSPSSEAFPHEFLDERKTSQCSWENRENGGLLKAPPLGLLGRAGSTRSHLSPSRIRVVRGHAVNPQNVTILFSKSSCTRFNELDSTRDCVG